MIKWFGTLVAGWFAVLAAPASAQLSTTANGPYYATPSWDQKLTTNRFVILANWNGEAVLDRETGIVWERQPNLFPFEGRQLWAGAFFGCAQKSVGGRKGWRLATVEELNSLLDGSTNRLPLGHPFIGVNTGEFTTYLSATRVVGSPGYAYVVGFGGSFGTNEITATNLYWCVRAPGGTSY
jgi:hypothetical protein